MALITEGVEGWVGDVVKGVLKERMEKGFELQCL